MREATFPLLNDPLLHARGITISARVESWRSRVKNRIVFRRPDGRETAVTCVHTAVCDLPAGEAFQLHEAKGGEALVERVRSTEFQPVDLPPGEHFVSLRSYVAGLAEIGLGFLLGASYQSETVNPLTLPFGFNATMQRQVVNALRALAPQETRAIVRHHVLELAETVTPRWFMDRFALLDGIYDLKDAIFTNFEAFVCLMLLTRDDHLVSEAIQYANTARDLRCLLPRKNLVQRGRKGQLGDLTAQFFLKLMLATPSLVEASTAARTIVGSREFRDTLVLHEEVTMRFLASLHLDAPPHLVARCQHPTHLDTSSFMGVPGICHAEAWALAELDHFGLALEATPRKRKYWKAHGRNSGSFQVTDTHVVSLSLPNCALETVPAVIKAFTQVRVLELDDNQIEAWPQFLAALSRLEVLNLAGNQLEEIPPTVARLTRLQELNLERNRLTLVVRAIGLCTRLARLKLRWNRLRELPATIGLLEHLTVLDVGKNRLTALPVPLNCLEALQVLSLDENPLGKALFEFVFPANIETLDVSRTLLSRLPRYLHFCSHLRVLRATGNHIPELPDARCLDHYETLEVLDLSDNHLGTIPPRVTRLQALEFLSLADNQISTIPLQATCPRQDSTVKGFLRALHECDVRGNPLPGPLRDAIRPPRPAPLKIMVFGEGGVGKTTYCLQLTRGIFVPDTSMTIGPEVHLPPLSSRTRPPVALWDIPGVERFRFLLPSFTMGAVAAILFYDTTRFSTLENLEQWCDVARTFDRDIPVLLVGTKTDLVDQRAVDEGYARGFVERLGVADYCEVSARFKWQVEEVFHRLLALVAERRGKSVEDFI